MGGKTGREAGAHLAPFPRAAALLPLTRALHGTTTRLSTTQGWRLRLARVSVSPSPLASSLLPGIQ